MAKMCMFSAVQGVVTEHGQPVAGAVVERRFSWAWKGETGTDRVQTDSKGHFQLEPVWRSSLLGGLLPHEPSVEQQILILHGDRTFTAWQFDRDSYALDGELFGRLIRLRCELDDAPRRHLLEQDYVRHSIFGICELDGVEGLQERSK